VRSTDLALRRIFERASREPWYQNTIFVLVADHTNQASHDVYKTDLGLYSIPVIFFTPDGTLTPALRDDVIVQQTDITPTLLHLLGYDKPYIAFGDDVLAADPAGTWAFNYNAGIYQLVKGDLLLQFDGTRTTAVYRFKTDKLLKNNLVGQLPEQQKMEQFLKALIQQYMSRMNENRLICKDE
jgi:phosphoglycerol transferase MdoB-like AlkP superfamily enzyme